MNETTLHPIVSIIIPAYNAEKSLDFCLQSVINQSYKNIDIIFIDDGSTDGTLSIAHKYSESISIYKQENKGACAARNMGIEKSKGKYIKFLDSDDFLAKNAVEKQVSILNKEVDVKVVPYGYRKVKSNQKTKIVKSKVKKNNQLVDIINNNITITLPMHRKKSLIDVGLFDEDLQFRQEWDLHMRLIDYGCIFKYHDDYIFTQVIGNSGNRISSRQLCADKELINIDSIRGKFFGLNDKKMKQAWGHKYWDMGRQFLKNDKVNEANIFFEKSLSLTKFINIKSYPRFYKVMVLVLGPYRSEKILGIYRKVRK